MKVFDLKVGWSCNNACIHCVINDKKKTCGDTSFEDLKKIIDNNLDYDAFVVTGGEPTIRKDFIDILKYIKEEKEKGIILQSNGRKFKDFNFALETASYVDNFLIAIHSYDPVIHDAVTQREGSWMDTTIGIRNLYNILKDETRGTFSFQFVMNKVNSINLLKSYDFMQNIFPGATMNLTHPHPSGSSFDNYEISVPKYENIKEEVISVVKKYKELIHIEAIPFCYLHPYVEEVGAISWYVKNFDAGGYDASGKDGIDPDTDVSFNGEGITKKYKELIRTELMKAPKCKECIYNDYCYGVWEEYIEIYKSELDLFPITEGKVPERLDRVN